MREQGFFLQTNLRYTTAHAYPDGLPLAILCISSLCPRTRNTMAISLVYS